MYVIDIGFQFNRVHLHIPPIKVASFLRLFNITNRHLYTNLLLTEHETL